VNFALFASHATRVHVCIFDRSGTETARYPLPARSGDVWHGLVPPRKAGPGSLYAFSVEGPMAPEAGHRFDPAALLLDPCARSLSAAPPLRSRVIDGAFDWDGDRRRRRPGAIP
jgi:glycogen operon protein